MNIQYQFGGKLLKGKHIKQRGDKISKCERSDLLILTNDKRSMVTGKLSSCPEGNSIFLVCV